MECRGVALDLVLPILGVDNLLMARCERRRQERGSWKEAFC